MELLFDPIDMPDIYSFELLQKIFFGSSFFLKFLFHKQVVSLLGTQKKHTNVFCFPMRFRSMMMMISQTDNRCSVLRRNTKRTAGHSLLLVTVVLPHQIQKEKSAGTYPVSTVWSCIIRRCTTISEKNVQHGTMFFPMFRIFPSRYKCMHLPGGNSSPLCRDIGGNFS